RPRLPESLGQARTLTLRSEQGNTSSFWLPLSASGRGLGGGVASGCSVLTPPRTPMTPDRIRIGNQTSKEVPAADPFGFALRNRFDAFEWFSDRGRGGWCEYD